MVREANLEKWESLRDRHRATFQGFVANRKHELINLARRSGNLSPEFATRQEKHQRADFDYLTINRVLLRPPNRYHVRWPFIAAFTLALALLETPINKFLFDIALYGSNITSWTVSFAFAVFLLILAHLFGKSVRQAWSEYRGRLSWTLVVVAVVCLLAIMSMIVILMIARDHMDRLASSEIQADIYDEMTRRIVEDGLWSSVSSAFSNTHALTLFAVNVGAVFMTAMIAFFTHDSDQHYDNAVTAAEKAARGLKRYHDRHLRQQSKLIEAYKRRLGSAARDYEAAAAEVRALKQKVGIPLEPDDRFNIWELDQLAEDIATISRASPIAEMAPEPPLSLSPAEVVQLGRSSK